MHYFLEHGDTALLRQFVDRIGIAVAAEVNILNLDYILLGGGVPNMSGYPKAYLMERIFFHKRKLLYGGIENEKKLQ